MVVTGRSGGPEPKFVKRQTSGGGGGGAVSGNNSFRSTDRLQAVISKHVGEGRGSKMILRAKKSDLDAVQRDKLSLEELRKKVTVQVY